jgi:hypothetical protein
MTQININHHCRINWTLEDLNGKVALETTNTCRGDLDGFNITVKGATRGSGETWMSKEEAESLRQWLNKALDNG